MNNNQKPFVFVLMPFEKKYNKLFSCIEAAADKVGAFADRVDRQMYKDKDVLDMIKEQIDKAVFLVAVTSENKPNVFYEIGLAHALRKHVILLTDNTTSIPFDLKHLPNLDYKTVGANLVTELAEKMKWHLENPTIGDKYYQEFKKVFIKTESILTSLMPYFFPIAKRYLNQWHEYVKSVVSKGVDMIGPERLDITRLLTLETKKYSLIEQISGNPTELHSKDWIDFYSYIGKKDDIDKIWILFLNMENVIPNRLNVESSFKFFSERNFATLYCAPTEFFRSTGENPPEHHVVEYFGDYIKLLLLRNNSYTLGDKPNTINTTIRMTTPEDRIMYDSITRCASIIDEGWIKNI